MNLEKMIGNIGTRLFLLWITSSFPPWRGVGGQGRPDEWVDAISDTDRTLQSPVIINSRDEEMSRSPLYVWWRWWESGGVGAHIPDIFENQVIETATHKMQLAAPLWGNPAFFCIDIPKMLYEGYTVLETPNGDFIETNPPPRKKIDKFNKEGVGWNTVNRRSKSRYLTAYSLFWIMEPTSFRWNRRFVFRTNVKDGNVPVDRIGWTTREQVYNPSSGTSITSRFASASYDPYTDVSDGRQNRPVQLRFVRTIEAERQKIDRLYWHVDVTGIRDPNSSKMLKGWYHLKITLRQDRRTPGGNAPVKNTNYSIDRLAVSARGLTFNHKFNNIGPQGFHSNRYKSNVTSYFDVFNGQGYGNRPHRVWEGGAGEFVRDFPKCRGVLDHKFVERQFVPCGTTGKNQWYYGNNFMLVNTDYPEYPDKSGMYGGGVIINGDHEEVHLNYKLDQSFCNMYLAVDFVVNGVVVKVVGPGLNVRTLNSRNWIVAGRDRSFAIERSSSTRISFVVDDHVQKPQPIAQKCKSPKLPLREFTPPIIKQGSLPELTLYGNADPIPPGVEELDCFVTLKEFNASPTQPQPEESFHGAIQEILPPETFVTGTEPRGLTLSYWYLFIRPWSNYLCVRGSSGYCQVCATFSPVIAREVKEWDWRQSDPSDFSDLDPGPSKKRWEITRVPYFDGTFKGFWVSYFDWVGNGLDPYTTDPKLNKTLIRYGDDVGWPTSRQIGKDVAQFRDDIFGRGSIFQPLYLHPVPFVGRATADKPYQAVYSGFVPNQTVEKLNSRFYTPFSGEPGHSPPACDLYVSRYYLRILDSDDDQYYNKDVGFPNDPADTCFVNTSRLTTDPALQYIRKVYVKPLNQNAGRRPTWYEKYLNQGLVQFCEKVKKLPDECPTMPPLPFTTPKLDASVPIIAASPRYNWNLRGVRLDNPASLYIWDSRLIHGIWMTILSHFIIPLIILLDRFYGDARLSGLRIYRVYKRWYDLRYILALIIFPIIGIGLQRQVQSATILGLSYYKAARYHWKAGWLMVYNSLFLAIVWGSSLRRTTFFRQYGRLIKWYCGTVIKFCNVLCMFTSVVIPGSPGATATTTDYKGKASSLFGESVVWVTLMWLIFDSIVAVLLFTWKLEMDYSDLPKDNESSRSMLKISPMPALRQHFKSNTEIRQRKYWTLIFYVCFCLITTVTICNLISGTDPLKYMEKGLGWMTCSHLKDGTVRETFPKNCPEISNY